MHVYRITKTRRLVGTDYVLQTPWTLKREDCSKVNYDYDYYVPGVKLLVSRRLIKRLCIYNYIVSRLILCNHDRVWEVLFVVRGILSQI